MTQIKLFSEKTPDMEKFEKRINEFLKENDGNYCCPIKIGID